MSGGLTYTYSGTGVTRTRPGLSTSPQELLQISVAFGVLSVDFLLILYFGGVFYSGNGILHSIPLWEAIATATVASCTAFVAHEMAHKISAQRGGYWAEFRWFPMWLAMSVVTSYLGFLLAAPGATMVGGMGSAKAWGKTSLAGPATNLVFAAIFYTGSLAAWDAHNTLYFPLLVIAFFNGWFAAFNLLPLGPLDGAKVLRWSTAAWLAAFAVAAVTAGFLYVALWSYVSPAL